ncbi:helix-turn-helix domain-containing protein [Dryocola clanedunensis]|uniref:helix-turn-helix domain-containing protein n=1 Tax=Cedecea sulfonylureivorans TaxID=3051154 RepID=UPI001926A297|nr:helix-turn-helix domain-containing protein [Cedecea sulfonylureivorans]
MVLTSPKRPDEAIASLINALMPLGERINVTSRKRIGWRTKETSYLYLLLRGEISVLRISDGLLLGTTNLPHVFGFTEMFSPMGCNMLRAETDCTLMCIDTALVLPEIDKQELWREVAELCSYHTANMLLRDLKIVNQRTPPVVHNYLQELDRLPADRKYRVNILNYIQERTGLSRSSILNVVSTLKKNNYIDYERGGYQLKINNLPD